MVYMGEYSLGYLDPQTAYDVRVKTQCDTNESSWVMQSFMTNCAPITSLPWTENFDTYGTTSGTFPPCWFRPVLNTTTPYPSIVSAYSVSSPASLRFQSSSATNPTYAITPQLDFDINTLAVTFQLKAEHISNSGVMHVGVMSDPSDTSTFELVRVITPADNQFYEYEVVFTNTTLAGVGNYIAFKHVTNNSAYYYWLDDVVVDYTPACPRVSDLDITAGLNQLEVDWVEHGNATEWIVEYKKVTDTIWTEEYASDRPYVINNLDHSTLYMVRVKASCGTTSSQFSIPITCATLCGQIENLPLSESFDIYGTGSSAFPICWSKISYSTTYPYISSTYSSSSPGSIYFYTYGETAYNYLITPEFSSSIAINTLSAYFKLYKTSASYSIDVGVMSDPQDTTTFNLITTLTPTTTSTWELFSVDFASYTGTGQYIAFRVLGSSSASNVMYMDDLQILLTPSCDIPTGLERVSADQNSITIDWDGEDDANVLSWNVFYRPVDATDWQTVEAFYHPYTITGLEPNQVYKIMISANCLETGTTYPSGTINVGMPCISINTFPWSEGFEDVWYVAYGLNTGTHPWCWTNINGGTSAGLWRKTTTSSYVHTGNGALQMYSGSTSAGLHGDWFISPVLSLTGNERLSFWAKGYSTYTDILSVKIFDASLGAVSTESDTTDFVDLMPNTVIPASEWTQYELLLSQYVGDYQIAFVRNTPGGYYLNIDDVLVEPIPDCARPANVVVTEITNNSAEIDFVPANQNSSAWYLYYKPQTSTEWDSVYINYYPYVLEGLSPNQDYQFYLRTDCGAELSLPTQMQSFTTFCDPIPSFPWTENFDTYGTTSGTFPPCWFRPVLNTTTPYPSIVTAHSVSSPASLRFQSASESVPTYAITPQLDADINTLMVTFQLKAESTTSSGTMHVGVMSNPYDPSTFELVQIITPTGTTFEEHEVMFSNTTLTGTGNYIAFKHVTNSSSWFYWLDDVVVDFMPDCPKPSDLAIVSIASDQVEVGWAENGSATSWTFEYKKVTDTTWTVDYVYDNPYTIYNLDPQTEYEVRVKSDCGTEESEYSPILTVTTPCPAVETFPYTENFDTYGTTAGTFPPCWFRPVLNTSTPYPSIVTVNNTPPGSLRFQSASASQPTFAITPQLDADINTLMITFQLRAESTTSSGVMHVGVMSNPYDTTTFELVQIITPTNTSFQEYEIMFSNTTLTGTGNYIAFKHVTNANNYYYWLDDVVVDFMPDCPKPTMLTAVSVDEDEIEVQWQENGFASSWIVEYKKVTDTTWTVDYVYDNPYTIYSLEPSTSYEIRIKADCGAEESDYSSVLNAMTACGSITTLPWSENFDTYGTTAGTFPTCWFRPVLNTTTPYPSIVTAHSVSSPASLRFQSASATVPTYAITPQLDADINTLMVTFQLKAENTTNSGVMHVGVMSNPYDPSTFELVQIITPTGTTFEEHEVMFSNTTLTGTGNYIAFKHVTNSSIYFYWLDDVVVDLIPSCPRPADLTASNVTQTSLDLGWVEFGTATAWEVEYGETGFTQGTGTILAAATNPVSITGLTESTCYDFYVRAVCAPGDESDWSNMATFCTSQTPVNVPFTIDFETASGFTFANNTSGNNWYIGSAADVNNTTGGSNGLYISDDNGVTNAYSNTSAVVWAFRDIYFTPSTDDYTLTFDWKCRGESTYDYFNVYIGAPVMPVAATTSTITAPAGATALGTIINQQQTWQTETYTLPAATYSGQTMRLYFAWRNDGGLSYQPPAAIDNIAVITAAPPCVTPTNLQVINITDQSATATWTAGGTETSWQVDYKLVSATNWTTGTATTTSFTMTGLQSNSDYHVRVKAICTGGESAFTDLVPFTTGGTATYTITATAGPNGTITPSGAVTVNEGGSQTFTFTPAEGYQINSVLVDNVAQTPVPTSYTFENVQANHTIHVDFTVGINENELSRYVTLYPNPTQSFIDLKLDKDYLGATECHIYDMYGKLMRIMPIEEEITTIDVSDFAAGVYFVRLTTEQGQVSKRFVKQ